MECHPMLAGNANPVNNALRDDILTVNVWP